LSDAPELQETKAFSFHNRQPAEQSPAKTYAIYQVSNK